MGVNIDCGGSKLGHYRRVDKNPRIAAEIADEKSGPALSGVRLAEAAKRGRFVRGDIENGEEPGDLHEVVHAPGEMHELQLAARAAHSRVGADQFADSRAVDVIDVAQIEEDFAVALVDELANHPPDHGAAFTQRDLPAEIYDRDVADFSACSL